MVQLQSAEPIHIAVFDSLNNSTLSNCASNPFLLLLKFLASAVLCIWAKDSLSNSTGLLVVCGMWHGEGVEHTPPETVIRKTEGGGVQTNLSIFDGAPSIS